jgi:ribosome-associated protein
MSTPFPITSISPDEVEFTAMRAQGAGGQNVNKVSSAVHLRFDIRASSLTEDHKERLLQLKDRRITRDGVVVIKSQEYRNQESNRLEALRRLQELVDSVARLPRQRKATKPTRGAQKRRLESKAQRGLLKAARGGKLDL